MSFRRPTFFNRRKGLLRSVVECDDEAFADESSKLSRQATQGKVEYGWESLDENTSYWGDFIVTLGSISSLKHGGLAKLPPEFRSGCLLHDAIQRGAPDDVLMFINERFPQTLREEDNHGRFPIHVACSFGCSPEFISHLVNMFPQSVAAKDNQGRTPIHHLCSSYASKSYDVNKTTLKRMEQILWILFRKSPGSIVAEDKKGVNAIECALEAELGTTFIGTLQDMTARYHENEARKAAQRRCMKTRRQLGRQHSPHAAFAA